MKEEDTTDVQRTGEDGAAQDPRGNIPRSPFLAGAATFQAGTGLTGFRSVRGTRCLMHREENLVAHSSKCCCVRASDS